MYCSSFLLHPLFIAFFWYSLGIIGQFFHVILSYKLIGLLLLGTLGASFASKKIGIHFLIYSCAFCFGAFRYQTQVEQHTSLCAQINQTTEYILKGKVARLERKSKSRYPYSCILENAELFEMASEKRVLENFCIGISFGHPPSCAIDDIVAFKNIRIKKNFSPSFQHYLNREGIVATVFFNQTQGPSLMYRPSFSFKRLIWSMRQRLLQAIKRKLSPQTFTFFSSLFLGFKDENYYYKTLKEQFKWWGLSHYLARSGLHLVLFIMLWSTILRFLPLTFILKHCILAGMIIVYFLLSWPSLPFLRSCLTYGSYFACILCNKQIHSLQITTLVMWAVLIVNPLQLFCLDFQLSFGLTSALMWFMSMIFIESKKSPA